MDKDSDSKGQYGQDSKGGQDTVVVASTMQLDPVKEAKMMRKFDFWAVGLLGLLYLLANLDRSNIGNAQIAGMPTDLGLVGNQYGTAVTLLYATYVPFEGPVAVLLKIIGPKYLLTVSCFCWGTICLATGFVQSWKGLYACRLLIGFFEAGLIPCINVYLGLLYRKSERGKRSSVIFAFSATASAFGGLFAYALTHIHTDTYFTSWRAMFIIEGILTILVCPLFYFFFPESPLTAWFLTSEEKDLMRLRYEMEPYWGIDEEFSWKAVRDGLTDPKWYLFWIFQFSVDISLYGFTTFLPAIITGMGYESVQANLMTVPIYVWGLVVFLFIAYMSDRMRNRGYWIGGALLCLIIGYAILISVDTVGVRYFACFITVMGIYPTTGMSMMWLSDNASQHFKRATMVGSALMLGNTAGVAVGQIFVTADKPRYIRGLSIAMGMAVAALACVATLMIGMHTVNKRRAELLRAAEEKGEPIAPQPEKGDYDVHFRLLFDYVSNIIGPVAGQVAGQVVLGIGIRIRTSSDSTVAVLPAGPATKKPRLGSMQARARKDAECVYPSKERKVVVPESLLRELEAEKKQVEQLRRLVQQQAQAAPEAIADEDDAAMAAEVANPVMEQRVTAGDPGQTAQEPLAQPVYVGAAACTAFTDLVWHHVQHVQAGSNSRCRMPSTPPRQVTVFQHAALRRVAMAKDTAADDGAGMPVPQLPCYTYATTLVDVVLKFVGNDYHFVRKKSFAQRIDQLYRDEESRAGAGLRLDNNDSPAHRMFLCRLFVVFALGELYLRKTAVQPDGSRAVPGTQFFLQAMSLFQELYEEPDIEYIETLLLMSFYSHALNRKISAYTYAGMALRLSVAMGLHRNITYDPQTRPVEIENRRRVWWTVYCFDRLCSSKLGHPIMIKDADIDAPLPSCTATATAADGLSQAEREEEFVDAAQLVANVRLARITGALLDQTYKIHQPHETTFIRDIHGILHSLKEWDATLPADLRPQPGKNPPYVSRSVASLRLQFNQCVILTTRPVLLFVFKHYVAGGDARSAAPLPTSIALSEACIYAARASHRLLRQLWIDGAIATFGYFDAHYIFSSTLILAVSHVLHPNTTDLHSIDLALQLLQSMADDGNLPACELHGRLVSFKHELDVLCRNYRPAGPKRGYITVAGTFAAHTVPGPSDSAPLDVSVHGYRHFSAATVEPQTDTAAGMPAEQLQGQEPLDDQLCAPETDPSLQQFLGQLYTEWSPAAFGMTNEEMGISSLAWDIETLMNS